MLWTVGGLILSLMFGFLQIISLPITSVSIIAPQISSWETILAFISLWASSGLVVYQQWVRQRSDSISK